MASRLSPLLALPLLVAAARAETYRDPPPPIPRILDAKQPPVVLVSPDRRWLLLLDRPELPPIEELAAPWIALGGFRVDPATNGPARELHYRGLSLQPLGAGGEAWPVELPDGARIGRVAWSHDSRRLAFTLTRPDGLELWVADLPARGGRARARRLTGPSLNAAHGSPCEWLPGDEGLLCRFVPEGRGPAPERPRVPEGPLVAENLGRTAAARTYTNLLKDAHDEALFDHYMTATVERVGIDGARSLVAGPAVVVASEPSPDGRWVLVSTIRRPYSHALPVGRFPVRTVLLDAHGSEVREIADLPLADDVPVTFDSVRRGPRSLQWRDDRPATLAWVEALDGGDAKAAATHRDVLRELDAPFTGPPRDLWRSELRLDDVTWGRDDVALVTEDWWATRRTRTWSLDPSGGRAPRLLWDLDAQDAYRDPGTPVLERGPHGWVLRLVGAGATSILLAGQGASPRGLHPFLDRLDLESGVAERWWQAQDPWFETVLAVLDDDARRLLTRRESAEEPPNVVLRRRGSARVQPLTRFEDPAPELAGVGKRLVTYRRADGVDLSATLYVPAGWDPSQGPLPTLFWAYPSEFKSRDSAGQVKSSPNRFARPSGDSILFLLTQGWAIVDGPTIPILGEGEAQPNDTYVEQLVAGARAAVDHVVSLGVADRDRCAIGGHSYGAFTAVNLLAHSDLFRAGIARSGAYNRTLTPFGFQGEERTFWEASDTYVAMSPFASAGLVDEPLLLVHGMEDSNTGTFPVQSERLYDALKGLGATVRLVRLPHEDHGYKARESVGHVLWEMLTWLDRHVKEAPARE